MKKFFPTLLLLLSCGLSAVAQPSGNPLVFGENRLTLITPTLFRLEFARDGKFIDDPTIFAYDRSNLLPADRFEVRALGGDRYEITTEALRIVYEHDLPVRTAQLRGLLQAQRQGKEVHQPLHLPQQPRRSGRNPRPRHR